MTHNLLDARKRSLALFLRAVYPVEFINPLDLDQLNDWISEQTGMEWYGSSKLGFADLYELWMAKVMPEVIPDPEPSSAGIWIGLVLFILVIAGGIFLWMTGYGLQAIQTVSGQMTPFRQELSQKILPTPTVMPLPKPVMTATVQSNLTIKGESFWNGVATKLVEVVGYRQCVLPKQTLVQKYADLMQGEYERKLVNKVNPNTAGDEVVDLAKGMMVLKDSDCFNLITDQTVTVIDPQPGNVRLPVDTMGAGIKERSIPIQPMAIPTVIATVKSQTIDTSKPVDPRGVESNCKSGWFLFWCYGEVYLESFPNNTSPAVVAIQPSMTPNNVIQATPTKIVGSNQAMTVLGATPVFVKIRSVDWNVMQTDVELSPNDGKPHLYDLTVDPASGYAVPGFTWTGMGYWTTKNKPSIEKGARPYSCSGMTDVGQKPKCIWPMTIGPLPDVPLPSKTPDLGRGSICYQPFGDDNKNGVKDAGEFLIEGFALISNATGFSVAVDAGKCIETFPGTYKLVPSIRAAFGYKLISESAQNVVLAKSQMLSVSVPAYRIIVPTPIPEPTRVQEIRDWCLLTFRPVDHIAEVRYIPENRIVMYQNLVVGRPYTPDEPVGVWEKRDGVRDYVGNIYTMWWPKTTLPSCPDFYGSR